MHTRVAVLKVGNVTTCQFVENIVSYAIFLTRGGFLGSKQVSTLLGIAQQINLFVSNEF